MKLTVERDGEIMTYAFDEDTDYYEILSVFGAILSEFSIAPSVEDDMVDDE